jgi:hypothetical protein
MDVRVREHIAQLDAWVKALSAQLMNEQNLAKRNAIDSEIRAARMALAHYRAATDIESSFDKGRA